MLTLLQSIYVPTECSTWDHYHSFDDYISWANSVSFHNDINAGLILLSQKSSLNLNLNIYAIEFSEDGKCIVFLLLVTCYLGELITIALVT